MSNLVIDFDSVTENDRPVYITAAFEHVSDFTETQHGEKRESYWHLIDLKIKHSDCPHMHPCGCYEPTDNDYEDYEQHARKLASQEVA